jgi:hypothetical protein
MWLVKVPIRFGSDYVVSVCHTKILAEKIAHQHNLSYDIDMYYIEERDVEQRD